MLAGVLAAVAAGIDRWCRLFAVVAVCCRLLLTLVGCCRLPSVFGGRFDALRCSKYTCVNVHCSRTCGAPTSNVIGRVEVKRTASQRNQHRIMLFQKFFGAYITGQRLQFDKT